MNKLTQTLLIGAAFCALMAAPVMAQPTHPAMRITALHAGRTVNKTQLHDPYHCKISCDYYLSVYSTKPANALPKSDLFGTYYKWNSVNASGYFTLCSNPKQKLKAPKKSKYARIYADTETYSLGCSCGPTVFHGDAWTNKTGVAGDVDAFVSFLIGKFKGPGGGTYKGSINLYVDVGIQ
jgi:hypothetical protein